MTNPEQSYETGLTVGRSFLDGGGSAAKLLKAADDFERTFSDPHYARGMRDAVRLRDPDVKPRGENDEESAGG